MSRVCVAVGTRRRRLTGGAVAVGRHSQNTLHPQGLNTRHASHTYITLMGATFTGINPSSTSLSGGTTIAGTDSLFDYTSTRARITTQHASIVCAPVYYTSRSVRPTIPTYPQRRYINILTFCDMNHNSRQTTSYRLSYVKIRTSFPVWCEKTRHRLIEGYHSRIYSPGNTLSRHNSCKIPKGFRSISSRTQYHCSLVRERNEKM
jgi:hypothetical protein